MENKDPVSDSDQGEEVKKSETTTESNKTEEGAEKDSCKTDATQKEDNENEHFSEEKSSVEEELPGQKEELPSEKEEPPCEKEKSPCDNEELPIEKELPNEKECGDKKLLHNGEIEPKITENGEVPTEEQVEENVIEPESNSSEEPDLNSSNKPESNTSDKPESNSSDKLETNTDKPDSNLSDKLDSNSSDKPESNLCDKLESNLSDKPESDSNDKLEPTNKTEDKPENKPERPTRGRKRKAPNSETAEQKENVDSKNNDSAHKESELRVDDPSMTSLSESNIMGKGKRARIPNKRYSDILLSPNRKSTVHQKSSESSESEAIEIKEEPVDLPAISSPGLSAKKTARSIPKENLQDPKYLKPFKYGWKRELVWRSTSTQSKPLGDIYYYTPEGRKVRSFREVSDHLTSKNLTLDNFSFTKEPLGIDDPEKEIIRDAKLPKHLETVPNVTTPKKQEIKKPKKVVSPKSGGADTSKAAPKPEPVAATPGRKSGADTAKAPPKPEPVVTTPGRRGGADTSKAPPKPEPVVGTPGRRRAAAAGVSSVVEKEKESLKESPASTSKKTLKMPIRKSKTPLAKKPRLSPKDEEPMEVEVTPPARSSPAKTSKTCQPCSIRCEGLQGIVPTLQCRVCLCLYHHDCVGLSPNVVFPYVCKNCHEQGQATSQSPSTIVAPPPLTPINSLKSVATTASTTLPKLQRIPRPDSSDPIPVLPPLQTHPSLVEVGNTTNAKDTPGTPTKPEMPKLTPKPPQLSETPVEGCKSLVGSVTSWLPHNVKIVNNEEPKESPRPQYVEYLAGRRFLVIPKHNFMSVSPTTPAPRSEESILTPTSLQPTEVPISSASLGPSTSSTTPNTPQTIPSSPKEASSEPTEEVPDIKEEPLSPAKVEEQNSRSLMELDNTEPKTESECEKTPGVQEDTGLEEGRDESASHGVQNSSQQKLKKRNLKVKSITHTNSVGPEEKNEAKFMENYLQNLSFGYNTLLYVFQYLKVQDLLRAGCVCTMWRDIASHPILWRTVRMKNSQVHSFEGLANTLKKHGTVHLDLRKMLLPSNGEDIWPEFSKAIARVDTLRKIELCRCPATVVEQLAVSNPNLEVINAVTIRCESMNLDPFSSLNCIRELRLKSTLGLNVNSIESLRKLKTLKILSLTSVTDLHTHDLNVIAELTNLESLDLGECTDLPKNFGQDILLKLEKLEKLRLEKGQGNCHTFEILDAVKNMKSIEQLELVNFDVKSGFDKALGACTNIRKLMIIPTYISQSATTNNMVLSGVLRLQGNLTHFVWGVTLELLRVTELFVDQCEDSNKKDKKPVGNGDSIPVLKPVPDLSNGGAIQAASNPPQVEILPLPNLQKLLLNSLPTTRVKILKIPFHATWRQTLTDSV